jgi:multicomponent Na+:H+ antiporter subunit C
VTYLMLALLVGSLLTTGVWLILRRGQVKLLLGFGLLTHGINLLLFGSGALTAGALPILEDKQNPLAEMATRAIADPLPQALILTAIVISFGITAFLAILVSRRDALTGSDLLPGELAEMLDPSARHIGEQAHNMMIGAAEDYDILQFELDELYDRPQRRVDEEA